MDVLTRLLRRKSLRVTRSPGRWPTVALVVAALIVCSAGAAGAAFLITGKRIKDGTVTGRDVRDHSLTAKDLKGVVRGPVGPAGPAGPAGPVGPGGAPGPAAISGAVRSSSFTDVGAFSSDDVRVTCPAGMVAVGGGGATQSNLGEIEQSAPSDVTGRGWTVSFHNTQPVPISVSAVAVCVTVH